MTVRTFPDPFKPKPFVDQVWSENPDLVSRFKLAAPGFNVVEGPMHASWVVFVTCGVDGPDALELNQAMRKLESLIEQKSGLDVTLTLIPASEVKRASA